MVSWPPTIKLSKQVKTRLKFCSTTARASAHSTVSTAKPADGVQLVVGPLEKPLVKQLRHAHNSPLPPSHSTTVKPLKHHPRSQFGPAAEDEAREVARRARADVLHPRRRWRFRKVSGATAYSVPSVKNGKPMAAPSLASSTSTSRLRWPSKWPI